jgi:integration host factor subunit alpha
MNKKDMVDALHEKVGFSKRETARIVDTALGHMRAALEGGDTIMISAFGTFVVKERKAQNARNLKTGEPILVPPRKTVTFKASPVLKERVNETTGT